MNPDLTPELKAYYAKGWLDDLRSDDPSRRKLAAEGIGRERFDDESVTKVLRAVFTSDPNEYVKAAARNALTLLGVPLTGPVGAAPAAPTYETIEFQSQQAYSSWLTRMGDSIEIINVSESRKHWSFWTGLMTNTKTITVTFKRKQPAEETDTKECPYCAETIKRKAKICRFCGREQTS